MASRFFYRDTIHAFLEGWDPEWRDLGIGKTVMAFSIEVAIKQGLKEYDYSIGDYKYKYDYATGERTNKNYIIFKSRVKMKIYSSLSVLDKFFR